MKKCSGKSNLDIVRSYLAGERPFTQVGYSPDLVDRKEGDTWEDAQGKLWVFKSGYKQRLQKRASYINEQRCRTCNADVRWGSRLDLKIWPKTGRCYDCNVTFETKLAISGDYDKYEKSKVLNNQKNYFQDMIQKINEGIVYVEPLVKRKDGKQVYMNEDGSDDTWSGDLGQKRKILADLKRDYRRFSRGLVKITDELKEINYTGEL